MENESKTQVALEELAFSKFAPIDDRAETKTRVDGILQAPLNRLNRDSYPINKRVGVAEIVKRDTNADAVVAPTDDQLILLNGGEIVPNQAEPTLQQRAQSYPVRLAQGQQAQGQSDRDISTSRSDFAYWDEKLETLGINVVYPNENITFWTKELNECVKLRCARLMGVNPDNFYGWPLIMKQALVKNMSNFTLEDIAAAVNGEYPASIQQTFVEWMFADNKSLRRDDRKLILKLEQPFRSSRDFIGVQARIAAINTWSFETVAPVNFLLKWSYGMPRPEEVAWLITKNEILDGLTSDDAVKGVVADIKAMGLTMQKDFTAYNKPMENGSPTHPSFPAMHSAASTISTWMPALFDFTPEQYEQALLTDYGTAMGRTVAGVHYPMDNIAGLTVGQHIIRDKLPAFVAQKYGYCAEKVKARLDALAFEWKDFDSKALTIAGEPAREFLKKANEATSAENLLGPVRHHY